MQRFVPLLIASANLLASCSAEAWSPKCDTPLRTYAWAGGFDSLLWVNDRTGGQTNSHFVAYDGNANVRALVAASTGLSSAEYEYGPFGDVIRATGPRALKNPIRFSSKYQDPESGLLYYGYRYYSAQHQKWLSRDPISYEGGLNLYGFVGNDPINGADELGLVSSLNFVPAAELAWMLGANAAFDTGVSIAMQKALADPCDRDWLDWGQVGKDVGIGAAIAITTAGTGKAVQLYRMSKRAKAVGEAAELAAKGQYDDLAPVLSQHGDDFGEAVVAHNRARAAAHAASANRVARAAGNAGQAASAAGRAAQGTPKAAGLFDQFGIVPGRGINLATPSAPGGRSYITYAFRNSSGEVTYVGRASGAGNPAEVLAARLRKGHDHFSAGLTPEVIATQKSLMASQGAEEFFIQGFREQGARLTNIDEALSFDRASRQAKSVSKIDAFFEELLSR